MNLCAYINTEGVEFLSSAGIEPKGSRIALRITDPLDLNRDVLKVLLSCLIQKYVVFKTASCKSSTKLCTHYFNANNIKQSKWACASAFKV